MGVHKTWARPWPTLNFAEMTRKMQNQGRKPEESIRNKHRSETILEARTLLLPQEKKVFIQPKLLHMMSLFKRNND